MADEQKGPIIATEICIASYRSTKAENRRVDGRYRCGRSLDSIRHITTIAEDPVSVFRELFKKYHVTRFLDYEVTNREDPTFSRDRFSGLYIRYTPAVEEVKLNLTNLPRADISKARRSPPRRTPEILQAQAKRILNILAEKNPLVDQLQNPPTPLQASRRQIVLEAAKLALAEYL